MSTMPLTRTLNQLICRVLIGLVLFAQFAVASYACPRGMGMGMDLGMTMETGVAPPAAEATDSSPAVSGSGDLDQDAPNLCAEHCKTGHQSHDTAPVPVLFVPLLALRYVLTPADAIAAADQPATVPDPLLAVPPPPHAILHCVLRT